MRRRTIQYLVLLAVLALSTHLYFNHSFHAVPEWMDDYSPFDRGGEEKTKTSNPFARPYPPPPKPKPQPTDADAGWAPGTGPPKLSDVSSRPNTLKADAAKRDAVVDAFRHAWSAYEKDAFGDDEYHPISHRGSNLGSGGGIGYTVVDALDTMLLMGLDAEYTRARTWVQEKLSFDRHGYFSMFETTIRVLGGLLSAFFLTGDDLYKHHAADLGDRLAVAFNTPSGLPGSSVNLGGRTAMNGGAVSISEATTLQLEFRYLAEITGRVAFWHKAEKVMKVVNKSRLPNGLAPITLNSNGEFAHSGIRMGSNGDSYYEYLLKQYIQTNRTEPVYLQMYGDAMQGVHEHLVSKTQAQGLTYIAELLPLADGKGGDWRSSWVSQPKQEHLACFLAGSLMLGATTAHRLDSTSPLSRPPRMDALTGTGQRDWATGVAFLEGCMDTHKTKTGLSPEGVNFRTPADPPGERDWYIKGANKGGSPPYDARYMLRPEIAESVFLAWRLTGDARYRSYAWDIFSAIEAHCRLPGGGYATVRDVDQVPVEYEDKQETFFLSETLKYLFLTFADENVLDLGEVVFNTEAHPLPIFNPSIQPLFTKYS